MSDHPDNIVLALLRKLDGKVDRLGSDMGEVKERLGILEQQGAGVSRRVDLLDGRLTRIERRLDLVEA